MNRSAALICLGVAACTGDIATPDRNADPVVPGLPVDNIPLPPGAKPPPETPAPPFVAAPARMHALTRLQVERSLADLFGEGSTTLVPPAELDLSLHDFTSVGATVVTLTGSTVEKLETLALSVADGVFDDAGKRVALVGCTPASAMDGCVRTFIRDFGLRVWRRPLETAELDALVALSQQVSMSTSNVWMGPRFAVVALLVSPAFFYRVEVAEGGRYSDFEMASRLSYALWNTTPDAELLQAAARGELSTAEQVRAQASRLLNDTQRSQAAARRWFSEYLGLEALDGLVKDRAALPRMSPTLGPTMRAELEHTLAGVTDLRQLFTVKGAWVDGELAGLYGLTAPASAEPNHVVITGGGVNLWGNADSFRFVSRPLTGDGEIVARVDSIEGGVNWAKAAVMIRESFAPGSRHAIAAVSPGHGLAFKYRDTTDGPTIYTEGPAGTAPYWVKLVRKSDVITGSVSPDGVAWTQMQALTLPLPQTVQVGVAYTNENDNGRGTATFSKLQVTGAPSAPAWSGRDIGAIAAPGVSVLEGPSPFVAADFPAEQRRTGIFGYAGILARTSKVASTSPTARGLFVRERLLCQELPPAPPNVDTTLPPVVGAGQTMRERLAVHRANPACAACHARMDPLGLALENFDALGEYRTKDQGKDIDASGELDGVKFEGLPGLMTTLSNSLTARRCLVRQVYRNATGSLEQWNQEAVIRDLAAPLESQGATYFELLLAVVTSDGFRFATVSN